MMWKFRDFLEKEALVDDLGNRVTYSELDDYCSKFYDQIGERCLIFCMCSNTIGGLLGYVASIQSGIVPLMLDGGMKQELLTNLIEVYHPKYIWMPEEAGDNMKFTEVGQTFYGYKLYKTNYDSIPQLFEELALLLTTSGSTGSPKLVRQSYHNIRANTKSIVEYLKLDAKERAITTLPMNYTYGISIVNTHLAVGATLLLTEKTLLQKEFWNFFTMEGATSFGGVPYTYEMLKRLRFFNMKLPSLRNMTQAGGRLAPELQEEMALYAKEKGISFFIMYGACEATARMSYLPAEKCLEKKGSIGIAIPGGRFELVDADGSVIKEPHVVGELVYYGENVTLGYAICPEDLLKGDERGSRLETGDMAYCDEDGYFYIAGRKKRFLKIFGNRFGLDEAETLLKQHFAGAEFACAGYDDTVYIFVVGTVAEDEVRQYIAHVTRINISAFRVIFIETIPRNSAGKIQYSELESYYD